MDYQKFVSKVTENLLAENRLVTKEEVSRILQVAGTIINEVTEKEKVSIGWGVFYKKDLKPKKYTINNEIFKNVEINLPARKVVRFKPKFKK